MQVQHTFQYSFNTDTNFKYSFQKQKIQNTKQTLENPTKKTDGTMQQFFPAQINKTFSHGQAPTETSGEAGRHREGEGGGTGLRKEKSETQKEIVIINR